MLPDRLVISPPLLKAKMLYINDIGDQVNILGSDMK